MQLLAVFKKKKHPSLLHSRPCFLFLSFSPKVSTSQLLSCTDLQCTSISGESHQRHFYLINHRSVSGYFPRCLVCYNPIHAAQHAHLICTYVCDLVFGAFLSMSPKPSTAQICNQRTARGTFLESGVFFQGEIPLRVYRQHCVVWLGRCMSPWELWQFDW